MISTPRKIPQGWIKEIESGTEFGRRAAAVFQAEIRRTPGVGRRVAVERKPCKACNGSKEKVGTILAERINGLLSTTSTSTCGCKELAAQMDTWGVRGCEQRRAQIVDAMVGNRDVLVESLRTRGDFLGGAAGFVASIVPDALLRIGAEALLTEAIDEAKRKRSPQRVHRGRKPYAGWRSEADGPRIEHGPFVSSIRHLTYHVWASNRGDSWQWNLEQLAKRWTLFNGKRILGVVHDKDSRPPDEVIQFAESLGMHFDHHIIKPNQPKLREVVTWLPMLELLQPQSAGANEVVFSAHAKGQKYEDPKHTRDWTDLMYQTCLDDWAAVYNALRTALMAGSFKEFGLLGKWHDWAFSGTFFWWRLAEIGKRNWRSVDQWFAGTESWPGKMCDPRETACLFLNDSRRMYDQQYWHDVVWPEWAKYQENKRVR